jgi:hypothetical protein
MNRAELEHIIRAASGITGQPDMVIVGSQAVLAQFPDAPAALLASMEADIYPRHRPDLSIQIDGAIGERSLFHETFGYYAHGVDETTATLPPGWQERLVPIHNENTGGATGWCLEVHDLAASKLAAGRHKDVEFVRVLLSEKLVSPETLARLVEALPLPPDRLEVARNRLRRVQSGC